MKTANNIPTIDTQITISTEVKDESTILLIYSLVPNEYIMDSVEEAKELLSKGSLYIELNNGCISSSDTFRDFEIDKGGFENESPIVAYKAVLIDNLAFATLVQYAFCFIPKK
mgnify:FL=1